MARQWLKLLCFVMANALALSAHATGLDGHDPVSYFAGGSPVKGSSAITAEFRGEQYHFSSAANRERFVADPQKYLPQYGGYCAYAVAKGSLAAGDPTVS